MKKIVGWAFTQLFYYLGDWTCKIADRWFALYGWFMFKSIEWNDWAGLEVWKNTEREEHGFTDTET